MANRVRLMPRLLATLSVAGLVVVSHGAAQERDRLPALAFSPLATPACRALPLPSGASRARERLSPPCASPAPRRTSTPSGSREAQPERKSKWALGLLGGALLGGTIGYALDVDGNDLAPEHSAALGAGVGALAGTLIGASIRVVESPEPQSEWRRGLATGAVGGAVLGAAIGLLVNEDSNDTSSELAAAVGASAGALGGAVVGAVIGRSIRVERSGVSGVQFRIAWRW